MRNRTGIGLVSVVILALFTGCTQIDEYKRELADMAGGTRSEITLYDVVNYEELSHCTYAYDCLSEEEKIWYEDMNAILSRRSDEAAILSKEGFEKGLNEENIDMIFQCVLLDHPEYFYVEGYEYTAYTTFGELNGVELRGTYGLSQEESLQRKGQIDEAVKAILEKAPKEASDYEKIKYVYETIISQTDYNMDAEDNQNIYSVFVGKESVCQGYAKATQYLLNMLGVECTSVYGTVHTGEGHAWNLVIADEEYYYVDTTWGDASYSVKEGATETGLLPEINYDYLCITTGQLENTHVIKHLLPLPSCVAWGNNYYIKEGCYFDSYDEEQLKTVFLEAIQNEKGYVTIKCSDFSVYSVVWQELIEQNKIFDYLDNSCETIAYIENEPQLSLTFWMTN